MKFDDTALNAALGARPPEILDRAGRVRLIGQAAKALMDNRMPSREAALFLGGAVISWLQNGGSLERDYLRVVKAKSRHTASYLWAHQDERQEDKTRE